jgi:hypothetical protein
MSVISSPTKSHDFVDYDSYIMSSKNQISKMRYGGRGGGSLILTYTDGTEWVLLNDQLKDRFCGYLYLQNALKEAHVEKIKAAPNKMAIHDREILYLSQYCGEKRLGAVEMTKYDNQLSTLEEAGFADMVGCTNLREMNEEIFVFDTEKNSFKSKVHEKIDSFAQLHDKIRSVLEDSIQTDNKKNDK